ncbi:unnamed protein product, partial [Rotaria socialis]
MCQPSTDMEIHSPSVVSKDKDIEKLHSFDFPIISFECKYILGNSCNAESIKKHRTFLEKTAQQMETKLNNEMSHIPIGQARILKQSIINNIDPLIESFKEKNRKRLDNLVLDLMKEKAMREIKKKCETSSSSSVDCKQARFTGDNNIVPAFPVCSSLSDFFDHWWIVIADQSCDV